MRYVLAFLILVGSLSIKGKDTLTIAQAYNFNIGDTFDYRIAHQYNIYYNNYYSITFERDIIVDQWVDSVLHVVKHVHVTDATQIDHLDTIIFSYPNQYAFYSDTICSTAEFVPADCYINPNSGYNGRLLNGNVINCDDVGVTETGFCNGLGQAYYYDSYEIEDQYGYDEGNGVDSNYLIYYSKNNELWGIPYYVADGSGLTHFTPIPETCGIWNDTVAIGLNQIGLAVTEQIKTGNRIPFHGHTYVEMIYSAYNYMDNHFTPDSLIGYFRNDTVNKRTLFYYSLSDDSFFAYNFNQLVDGNICVAIDTIVLNGQRHTRWTYGQYPFGNTYFQTMQYAEGIGGLNGLIPVYHPCGYLGLAGQSPYVRTFGALTCFGICGQTIYPNDTSAECPLISGITEVGFNTTNIRLYPTLNDGQFQIDVSNGRSYKLLIYDILGRLMQSSEVQEGKNFIALKNPYSGVCLWQVMDNEKIIQTGRFVVAFQH